MLQNESIGRLLTFKTAVPFVWCTTWAARLILACGGGPAWSSLIHIFFLKIICRLQNLFAIREGSCYQIGWIFEKVPKRGRGSFSMQKFILQTLETLNRDFFCNSVFHYWRSETPWVGLRPPGLRNVTIFLPIWNIQLVAELCVYMWTHFSWLLLLTFSLALFCLLCRQHS